MERFWNKIMDYVAVVVLIGVLILGFLIGLLVGRPQVPDGERMKLTESRNGYEVLLDTYTGVSYLVVSGRTTVLVQYDGTPFVENGWRDWEGE